MAEEETNERKKGRKQVGEQKRTKVNKLRTTVTTTARRPTRKEEEEEESLGRLCYVVQPDLPDP